MKFPLSVLCLVCFVSCDVNVRNEVKVRTAVSSAQLDSLDDRQLMTAALNPVLAYVYGMNKKDKIEQLTRGQAGLYFLAKMDSQVLKSGLLSYFPSNQGRVSGGVSLAMDLSKDTGTLSVLKQAQVQYELYQMDLNSIRKDSGLVNEPMFALFSLDSTYRVVRDETAGRYASYIRENKYLFFDIR